MKLRAALAVLSLFLSLANSADHRLKSCAGCWTPRADLPPVDETLGVNIHFIEPQPGEVKMIADAGFRWVRTDFKWELTERKRGEYDFSPYDALLKELEAFKIRALFILDYGNPLYTEAKSVRTPAAQQAFARWAVAAAKHFSGRRIIWELFNEPNISMFWPPQPNVEEYQALALEVSRSFHASVPNEQLIGPATSPIDFDFLESCFKARAHDGWSAISVHPYRQTSPETAAVEYAKLRELIGRYSNAAKEVPIISSEWGYSSAWPRINDQTQAVMLTREFLTNVANGIALSIWYDWRDDGADPAETEHHFGLVHNEYRNGRALVFHPKPAFLAARTLTSSLRGYRFEQRVVVGSSEDYVLMFRKDGERRIVAWTNSTASQRVTLTNLSGPWSVISFTGDNLDRVIPANGVLTIELTSSPKYLIPTR